MKIDFATLLFGFVLASGVLWLLDAVLFAPARRRLKKALALTGIRAVLKSRLRPSRGVFDRLRGPSRALICREGPGPA